MAKSVKPSAGGKLEINNVNQAYMERSELDVELLGRGFARLDTGTHGCLLETGGFVKKIEHWQGLEVACLEEIAFNQGCLDTDSTAKQWQALVENDRGQYLINLIGEGT